MCVGAGEGSKQHRVGGSHRVSYCGQCVRGSVTTGLEDQLAAYVQVLYRANSTDSDGVVGGHNPISCRAENLVGLR